ncbi:MAG TPA: nucleotidyltransferase family protein, partial [Anaerolineales bacterium]
MNILPDPQEEAHRIVRGAAQQDLTFRLLGGAAISLHSPSASHRALARSYPDLDFVLREKRGDRAETFLTGLGYSPDKPFNLYNGQHRLLFHDPELDRQVDVFVAEFRMCHSIPLGNRL